MVENKRLGLETLPVKEKFFISLLIGSLAIYFMVWKNEVPGSSTVKIQIYIWGMYLREA